MVLGFVAVPGAVSSIQGIAKDVPEMAFLQPQRGCKKTIAHLVMMNLEGYFTPYEGSDRGVCAVLTR